MMGKELWGRFFGIEVGASNKKRITNNLSVMRFECLVSSAFQFECSNHIEAELNIACQPVSICIYN